MPTPSLLIVPARFKTGRLYSQIPVPVAPSTSSVGDFNVTRATVATRVNASGLIESVASGIPRLDYFASGGVVGCPALLVEPAATNFVPSGTNVGGDAGVSRTATTTSPAVDINGTIIAKTVTGTTNLYASQICLTSLPSGSTTYTISRFFKYNGTDLTTSLEFNAGAQWGGTTWNQKVVISAASGVTLGASTACTGSVENYGNGWYRVSARLTTGATPTGAGTVTYLMIVSGSVASGSSFLTALPQLEVGSVATSYIPTTTAAVTRNADVVSVSGAVSGSIGQSVGTFYVDLTVLGKDSTSGTRWLQIFGASNNIGLAMTPPFVRSIVNGQSDTLTTAPPITSGVKIAWAYDASGTVCFINGTQYTLTNGGNQTMSSLTSISINGGANAQFARADIRAAALYTTRLTDEQLQALTT